MIYTKFNQIPLFKYQLIMADPPWAFETYSERGHLKAAQNHYECWDLERIKNMRVGDLAAKDCLLWLWATNPMLPEAIEVLRAWGFTYKTGGHWSKRNQKTNKQAFGPGYILRECGEPFLIGTMGDNITVSKSVRSVIEGPRRKHSQKPEEAFAAAEQLIPNGNRLELFSRASRKGWDVFGDQVDEAA